MQSLFQATTNLSSCRLLVVRVFLAMRAVPAVRAVQVALVVWVAPAVWAARVLWEALEVNRMFIMCGCFQVVHDGLVA